MLATGSVTRGIVSTFRAPNNQSLTRLVLPLSSHPLPESSDVTADIADTGPFSRAAKLWHVGFASILLNYLPAWPPVVSPAPWIDKLPDPVFRRHVTLNAATSNTDEKCYGSTEEMRPKKIKPDSLNIANFTSSSFFSNRLFSNGSIHLDEKEGDVILLDYYWNEYLKAVWKEEEKDSQGRRNRGPNLPLLGTISSLSRIRCI